MFSSNLTYTDKFQATSITVSCVEEKEFNEGEGEAHPKEKNSATTDKKLISEEYHISAISEESCSNRSNLSSNNKISSNESIKVQNVPLLIKISAPSLSSNVKSTQNIIEKINNDNDPTINNTLSLNNILDNTIIIDNIIDSTNNNNNNDNKISSNNQITENNINNLNNLNNNNDKILSSNLSINDNISNSNNDNISNSNNKIISNNSLINNNINE